MDAINLLYMVSMHGVLKWYDAAMSEGSEKR